MKILTTSILLFIGLFLLNSCDCLVHVHGVILEPISYKPVENVMIKGNFKNNSTIVLSNNYGRFEYTLMVPGIFGCPLTKLSFEKNGFESARKSYRSCCTENDTILLNKIE